jgi:hypothetical protein
VFLGVLQRDERCVSCCLAARLDHTPTKKRKCVISFSHMHVARLDIFSICRNTTALIAATTTKRKQKAEKETRYRYSLAKLTPFTFFEGDR